MTAAKKCRPEPVASEAAYVRTGDQASTDAVSISRPSIISSRQVSWWWVHEYVAATLVTVGTWPMVGTPAWCALDDHDPVKIAALFDAAQHHALRVETAQQARCDASRDIADAEDWSAISNEIRVRNEVYIPRRVD
jgi:hypothetical protein